MTKACGRPELEISRREPKDFFCPEGGDYVTKNKINSVGNKYLGIFYYQTAKTGGGGDRFTITVNVINSQKIRLPRGRNYSTTIIL